MSKLPPLNPPLYRIDIRELDDLVVWCFSGQFQFDSHFSSALKNSRTEIEAKVPASTPILIDLSRMRYVYRESLDQALCNGVLLSRKGYHAAVLIEPTNPQMSGDINCGWREAPIAIFEERESALTYLREPRPYRSRPEASN